MIKPELDVGIDPVPQSVAALNFSVVVPAWNEGWCIAKTLTNLADVLQPIPGVELIVVDDGSTDDTVGEVHRWMDDGPALDAQVQVLSLETNCGKGRAVLEGIRRSRGLLVAYIDADLDIPAEELRMVYDIAREVPGSVLVGTKQVAQNPGHRTGVTRLRRLVSRTFAYLVPHLFHLPVHDTQTGLKLYPGPVARRIAQEATLAGYLFDVELLILAHLAGVNLQEVPIRYIPQRPINRIGPRHLFRSVRELMALYHHYGHQTRKDARERGLHYAHSDA